MKSCLDSLVNAADNLGLLISFLNPLLVILNVKIQIITFFINLLVLILTKISVKTRSIESAFNKRVLLPNFLPCFLELFLYF